MKLIGTAIIIIMLALAGGSCSPIKYRTFFDVSQDPTYDFKAPKTIGLAPVFWTVRGQAGNIDELKEKQFLMYIKAELEKRGFSAEYISPDKLTELDGKVALKPAAKYPDLILTCEFSIQPETVKVPGGAFGRHDATGGYYSKTQSYEVQTSELSIVVHLWTGSWGDAERPGPAAPPENKKKNWDARITQGSPLPDLSDRAQSMI